MRDFLKSTRFKVLLAFLAFLVGIMVYSVYQRWLLDLWSFLYQHSYKAFPHRVKQYKRENGRNC